MMGNLNRGLREAFVELYEGQDFLATLGERARRELPEDVTLPVVPEARGLDLNEVLVSPYFFS
jgi:DNA-directed RNA polymerase